MFDRVTASRHFQTSLGAFALALGLFCAVSLVIGVAVLLSKIAEVM